MKTLKPGIVHLGLGAFARAHLLPATDDAFAATGDERFGVVGVSLQSTATRDALQPHGWRYMLRLRDAAGEKAREIESLLDVLHAPSQAREVLEHLAGADTRIVSLTVTEKGYLESGPGSTLDWLLRGLAERHASGAHGLTLMSLDNLAANGRVLRDRLLREAQQRDSRLAAWIEASCSFPCSMVDRIVPRSADLCDIAAEPFFDWALEDRFAAGRPAWEHGGATLVEDAAPYEARKLRMVNGAHSALAYLGIAAGYDTVDQAIADPALWGFIEALLREEIEPTLHRDFTVAELERYRLGTLERFANPALYHRLLQIAMDGSQKIPQRWLPVLRERLQRGLSAPLLAQALAGWWRYLDGIDGRGRSYAIEDPQRVSLSKLALRRRAGHTSQASEATETRAQELLRHAGLGDEETQPRTMARELVMAMEGFVAHDWEKRAGKPF